jgi:YQGE family putative transporter
MASKVVHEHKQILNQLGVFKLTLTLVQLTVWAYYYILLYRETGSIQLILTDYLVFVIGISLGFIVMSLYIDRLGYLNSFRISSFAQILTLVLIFFLQDKIMDLFIVFAVLRGFSRGMYWPIDHTIQLKEVHGTERGKVLSLLQSAILLLNIIVPVMAGALITYTGSYDYTFIIGISILIGSIFIPFDFNKKTRSKVTTDEIRRILKMKNIGWFSLLCIFKGSLNSIMGIMFMIIPYILIGEEFGVGALTSVIGFFAVIAAWLDSKSNFKVRLRLGYFGYIIYSIFTVALAFVWTIPALVIRSLALAFTQSLSDPVGNDLDYRVREKILGEFQNESAIEMNMIVEILYIIGRVVIIGTVIVIFSIFFSEDNVDSAENIIRFVIGFVAPIHLLLFIAFDVLNRKVKVH